MYRQRINQKSKLAHGRMLVRAYPCYWSQKWELPRPTMTDRYFVLHTAGVSQSIRCPTGTQYFDELSRAYDH
jgi:hypothetical protein